MPQERAGERTPLGLQRIKFQHRSDVCLRAEAFTKTKMPSYLDASTSSCTMIRLRSATSLRFHLRLRLEALPPASSPAPGAPPAAPPPPSSSESHSQSRSLPPFRRACFAIHRTIGLENMNRRRLGAYCLVLASLEFDRVIRVVILRLYSGLAPLQVQRFRRMHSALLSINHYDAFSQCGASTYNIHPKSLLKRYQKLLNGNSRLLHRRSVAPNL